MAAKKNYRIITKRNRNSHKGDYGHVLIVAGSLGLTGAAYLTSQACLVSGSGLVTLAVPKSLNSIMEVKLTEVMTKPLAQTKAACLSLRAFAQIKRILPKITTMAIGPGLSQNRETKKLVRKLLLATSKPIVLDADGINALIGNLNILQRIKGAVILTPHPGEMARLLRLKVNAVQKRRKEIATKFAQKYKVLIVLKGQRSVVVDQHGQRYINATGNPGMASAGSGDVLTGIIAAFLAQGLEPFQAAKSAVYIHGLAGDFAAREQGEISVIASDILKRLPKALKQIS